jgi:glycine cleavage system H protein
MNFPKELRYTKEHEWVRMEGDVAVVGITEYAQSELGDVVFVDIPKVGRELKAMETFGVVESVKSVSDLYSPVSGTVAEVNSLLESEPEWVNKSPYDRGWMIKIRPADSSEMQNLLDAAAYADYVGKEKE